MNKNFVIQSKSSELGWVDWTEKENLSEAKEALSNTRAYWKDGKFRLVERVTKDKVLKR